jgi:hypothetical protein
MQSHAVSRLPKVHNYRHMKLCKLKEKKEVQMDPFYLETAFIEVLYMPKQLSLFCNKVLSSRIQPFGPSYES